jgi:phosphate butyryltransferase
METIEQYENKMTLIVGDTNSGKTVRTGRILSHVAAFEIPGYHKLLFMSDGGMNPRLDLKARIEIINNAVEALSMMGIDNPKIGLVAASETVNADMPETVDAVQIVEMHKAGQIADCMIDGPFGFDVAVSKKAAQIKKIESGVAGDVDFILMPNISAANIWAKGLMYFADTTGAGMVLGALRPIIMLSRADDAPTKLNSIALGVIISKN